MLIFVYSRFLDKEKRDQESCDEIGPVWSLWGGAHPGFLGESSGLRPGQHVGSVKSGCGGGTNTRNKTASKSKFAVKSFRNIGNIVFYRADTWLAPQYMWETRAKCSAFYRCFETPQDVRGGLVLIYSVLN